MRSPPDLRLVPLAACAWALTWCATGGLVPTWSVVAIGVGAVGVVALLRFRPRVAAAAVLGVAMLAIGAIRADRLANGAVAELAHQGAWVSATVVIPTEPRMFDSRPGRAPLALVRAELVTIEGRGGAHAARLPVRITASGDAARALVSVAPGSTVEFDALARAPDPGEPVVAVLRVTRPPVLLSDPSLAASVVNRVREALRNSMSANQPLQAALVPSLVVGDVTAIDDETATKFEVTALTHLMAVSGANLTLLLAFLLVVVKAVGVRGWGVRVAAILGVVAFIAVCRAEPSVLRAAAMGAVALAALGAGRDRARGIRHLCVAIIVLLMVDPWLARTWGFALSVTASAGILWWAAPWQTAMRRWAPGWLADAICIPLAAQLATQPLITALSGQVSVIGVLANAAVGAFVGPATVLGLLAALFGAVWSPLGIPFGWLAGWSVQPILWGAELGSSLPVAAVEVPATATGVAAVAFGSLTVALAIGASLHRRLAVVVLVATLLIASAWRPGTVGWPGDWTAVFCDVGQGDATVLRVADGEAALVDVGPPGGAAAACLAGLGIRKIPLLVLTHYHADHVGGLDSVLGVASVGEAIVSRTASPQQMADSVRVRLEATGARVREASPGEMLTVGRLTWVTAAAGGVSEAIDVGGAAPENSAENDASVIGVATVDGMRMLLAGDAEPTGQRRAIRLAAQLGLSLSADVLKLPHHGSSRQDEEFFRLSGATLAVASAGRRNDYGHPSAKAMALAQNLGMAIRRTDEDGSLAVRLAEAGLAVRIGGP